MQKNIPRSFRLELQVLANLLENSLKFTRANDSILVSVAQVDDVISIRISDTGIGIPAADRENLFKRFHRERNVSEFAGNGPGLANVKTTVETHGGQVLAESNGIGKGSEFTILLPAWQYQ